MTNSYKSIMALNLINVANLRKKGSIFVNLGELNGITQQVSTIVKTSQTHVRSAFREFFYFPDSRSNSLIPARFFTLFLHFFTFKKSLF